MSNTLFEFPDNVLENVAKTFNKTEDQLNKEVQQIRKWLETQNHLPELMDERLVKNFYLLNKCRMDKTKAKIDNYYTLKSQSIFDNINPKLANMKFFMETIYFLPLSKMTEEMYRVMVWKVRDPTKISDSSPYDVIRHFINVMEIELHEDVTYGIIIIADTSNLSIKFWLKITPLFLYKFLVVILEGVYSSRLKALYVFNCPNFMKIIMDMMKKIVKPKVFNRFHICQDFNIVREKIAEDILPKDFGGSGRSLEEIQEILINKFVEYQDRFDRLDQLKVDEDLRPAKEKTSK